MPPSQSIVAPFIMNSHGARITQALLFFSPSTLPLSTLTEQLSHRHDTRRFIKLDVFSYA